MSHHRLAAVIINCTPENEAGILPSYSTVSAKDLISVERDLQIKMSDYFLISLVRLICELGHEYVKLNGT